MNALEMLKILSSGIQGEAERNTEIPNFEVVNVEEINVNSVNVIRKNPLLINTVIHSVFQFLPLNEIKKCRLVNQQWNTTAGPFLRKIGVIHFKHGTGASRLTSIIHDLQLPLPDLPFTAFRFSGDGVNIWKTSLLKEFFEEYGHNIKSLEFRNMFLRTTHRYVVVDVDVHSWIAKAKNLTKLIIDSGPRHTHITVRVDLDKLRSMESISLNYCDIFTSYCSGESLRIAPRDVTLNYVRFPPKEQQIQTCLNDVIDFSFASKIDIKNTNLPFDMSKVILKAKSVNLDLDYVKNWERASGKIDSLFLCNMQLMERNHLEIKELTLESGSIDLSVLPQTIEKLRFQENTSLTCSYFLQLPNLRFLGFDEMCHDDSNKMILFAFWPQLVELKLIGPRLGPPLHLVVIPESVNKLKIRNVKLLTYCRQRQLDTLIIEEYNFKDFFPRVTQMLSNKNLKINVLVISCLNVLDLYTSEIIRFVKSNMGKDKTFEKLVIGVVGDVVFLNINYGFEGSVLSRNVDKQSNYYLFTNANEVGKAITVEEFFVYANSDGQ